MWLCMGIYVILVAICVIIRKKKISLNTHEELFKKIVVLIFCVTTVSMGIEIMGRMDQTNTNIKQIERNGYGEGQKSESLKINVEGEETQDVEIQISPRVYGEEELQKLFHTAMEQLDEVILGDNESVDHVDKDLNLVGELEGFPFTIVWELERYDVMDMKGRIIQEKVTEVDPQNEGVLMRLTGMLRYESREAVYSTQVRIFAGGEQLKGTMEQVMAQIRQVNESTRESPYLTLPKMVDGKEITWSRNGTSKTIPLLLLGAIGCVLMICLDRQKKEQEKKDRQNQMLLDYPEIISQFTMLMGAGMTAKNVWKKMAEDYGRSKGVSGETRAAYEEILCTYKEMSSGMPEKECYERFARRCELIPYMKLGALLAQNLKKGSKGIAEMLTMEAVQAMEDRKSRTKQLGEEAGTKLLVPMLLMLVVVLTIVVVPAFWSIQI